MQLTDEQKKAVARWVEEGCSLAEIQKKLAEEFHVSATYMDVRLLVIDLGLEIRERARAPQPAEHVLAPEQEMEQEYASPFGRRRHQPQEPGGRVTVTLDRVQRPGALVSGSVVFSDGVRANWALDQLGRVALEAEQPGYSPSEEDIRAFQDEFRKLLEERGF